MMEQECNEAANYEDRNASLAMYDEASHSGASPVIYSAFTSDNLPANAGSGQGSSRAPGLTPQDHASCQFIRRQRQGTSPSSSSCLHHASTSTSYHPEISGKEPSLFPVMQEWSTGSVLHTNFEDLTKSVMDICVSN